MSATLVSPRLTWPHRYSSSSCYEAGEAAQGRRARLFLSNDVVDKCDRLGLEVLVPVMFNPPNSPPPYGTNYDGSGLLITTIRSCNVLAFVGHGLGYRDRSPVVRGKIPISELNRLTCVPSTISNAPCSSAEVLGCNVGSYVVIQTPTPGAQMPTSAILDYELDVDSLWSRAIAQAKAICNSKGCCCSHVTVTLENRLPWYLLPNPFSRTRTEVVNCSL